ncbi:heavy-metal-associated domain-containing protein [candidate division KSB1 bacterium]|nr:heavy-metal-associated domain-containing protein [candidate division KSB1 bacterium]
MKSLIKVDEMTCNHCKMVVEKAVSEIEGVESYDVNLEDGMVEIVGEANMDDVVSAIHKVGYRARRV